jgi:trigger factor
VRVRVPLCPFIPRYKGNSFKMPNTAKKISESKWEIEIEIPVTETTEEMKRITAQYSSRAKVRGFRPGKAPEEIIKRMYYPDIKETLINSLVPKALNKELKDKNVIPVGQPIVSDLHFSEGEPLRFKAQIEVWPELHLPEYKNIRVEQRKASVTEKELKESLEELRLEAAQYIPVTDRGVVDEDYVVAEIKGHDTKTKRFLPTEKVVILAGHPENEEILNQKLLGLKSGDQSQFTIKYKKDHTNKKLAAREIQYDLKIESIKEKMVPEIDDDFAKDLGDYKNLKDLKTKLKDQLLQSKKNAQRREMAEEIVKKIAEKVPFELPESVVEHEYTAQLNRRLSAIPQQDLSMVDLESLKKDVRTRAIQNIKNHIILNKIAQQEKIEVTEEEITEEMKVMAKSHNVPLARVVESINKEDKKQELRDNLLLKKTVDFLVKSAIIE